jgi:hypothetical protein
LTILNGVNQYFVDNGSFPTGTPAAGAAAVEINSTTGTGSTFCTDLVPTYVAAHPFDPSIGSYTDCTTHDTGYTIAISATGDRVTIAAPESLNDGESSTISATR